MLTSEFLEFLQSKVEARRAEFLEAKLTLEDYEREWGSLVYVEAWEHEAGELAQRAAQAYADYRKSWTEWYAATNGYSLQNRHPQKDTPGFASPFAIRERRDLLEIDDVDTLSD